MSTLRSNLVSVGIAPAGVALPYITLFPTDEDPISQGGIWLNGAQHGIDWNNVRTQSGVAFGKAFVGGPNPYNDDIAILNPAVVPLPNNQYARATVARVSGYSPGSNHEVELLLRFAISPNVARGYEVLWAHDGGIYVVRWNGPVNSFTDLGNNSAFRAAVDGDDLIAQIINNSIKVYLNGVQVPMTSGPTSGPLVLTGVDTTAVGGSVWTSGQTGIGFFPRSAAPPPTVLSSFGWRRFETNVASAGAQGPSVPQNLAVTGFSTTSVDLNWDDNAAVSGLCYQVWRSVDGTNFSRLFLITAGSPPPSNYSSTGLTTNQPYFYYVTAGVNVSGSITQESGPSNTVTETPRATLPIVPTGLSAVVLSATSIGTDWDDQPAVPNLAYRVYRSVNGGAYTFLKNIQPAVSADSDAALTTGLPYSYKVSACTLISGVVSNETAQSAAAGATPAATTAPTYWTNLNAAPMTWAKIADGPGQHIQDVAPNPGPVLLAWGMSQQSGGIASSLDSWSGGAYDTQRNLYWLNANGGHADYCGNESYVLDAKLNSPFWMRATAHSPVPPASPSPYGGGGPFQTGALGGALTQDGNGVAVFDDGYPRADHSTYQTFADDRVWKVSYPNYSSGGNGNDAVTSFNTTHPDLLIAMNYSAAGVRLGPQAGLLAHDPTIKPWAYHGMNGATQAFGPAGQVTFGVSAFDSLRHRVWGFGGKSASMNAPAAWFVSTQGATLGQSTPGFTGPGAIMNAGGAVYCPDMDIIVVIGCAANTTALRIGVLNCATKDWRLATFNGGSMPLQQYYGLVYDEVSHRLGAWHGDTPGTLYSISIPRTGSAYNPAGTFLVSAIPIGGVAVVPSPGPAKNPGPKFTLIKDLGDGRSGIIHVVAVNGPTYVMKFPITGLPSA